MIARRAFIGNSKAYPRYRGGAEQICGSIVKKCYNGTYFRTSTGHFSTFWMRDFGICVRALMNQGYKKEVHKSLQYALTVYSRENKLTTTISRDDKPFDVFTYSPDTLAFLIRSLRVSEAKDYIEIYKPFLRQEIFNFFDTVVDQNTGLVKTKDFSSMKDNAKRKSSCYDNCMVAMLASDLKKLDLDDPFEGYNYKKIIKDNFWQGYYFYDDLYSNYVAGDANTFPFWCGVFDDRSMFNKALKSMREAKLEDPFPLKYTADKKHNFRFPQSLFASNYQGNSVWIHLGLCFLDVVAKFDKKLMKEYLRKYTEVIEENRNFLELFKTNGQPYKTFFYRADEGMLWAAKYLELKKI